MASDFEQLHIPLFRLDERHGIFEDRLQAVLKRLREFRPTVVLANLSPISFEVLRYVPPLVFRIGAVQSDDPAVYETARRYVGVMDAIAAVSAAIKRKIEADPGFAGVPVKYLPYGVPMPEALALVRGRSSEPMRILYLGRLEHEQKRVRLFPEILRRLEASGIPFRWTIAGDGSERPWLEANLRTSPGDQAVSILGNVPYAQVPRLLATHDIFLLTSDYEGLPLSLLEAMGHGLVPVVSNLPSGIPEVVDENTGKLVPQDNTAGYAEAIIALHNHPDEIRRLSLNARERVQRDFSVTAMADRWLNAFPEPPRQNVIWPEQWQIKPILGCQYPLYFSSPIRWVRRLFKKALRYSKGMDTSLPSAE